MTIELNNKEWLVLNQMLNYAVANGNRVEPIAFVPATNDEYRTCCKLWNKIDGKAV